jgi:hypothetical protein
MSNKKVREQLEAQEAKNKFLETYKKKSDFVLNFQMCKAYFKDSGLSVLAIIEKILKAKYNLPWQEKLIKRALNDARGKTNPLISIPQFKFEKNTHDILADYVIKNFDKMLLDRNRLGRDGLYPLKLREILGE